MLVNARVKCPAPSTSCLAPPCFRSLPALCAGRSPGTNLLIGWGFFQDVPVQERGRQQLRIGASTGHSGASEFNPRAFRWPRPVVMQDLGAFPNCQRARAWASSVADGLTAVGGTSTTRHPTRIRWTSPGGVVRHWHMPVWAMLVCQRARTGRIGDSRLWPKAPPTAATVRSIATRRSDWNGHGLLNLGDAAAGDQLLTRRAV
jgi:hypothetical protein